MAEQAIRPHSKSAVTTQLNEDSRPFAPAPSVGTTSKKDDEALSPKTETSSSSTPGIAMAVKFFWLLEFKPSEVVSSFLKSLSAKSSNSFYFQKKKALSAKFSTPWFKRKDKANSPISSHSHSPTPSAMAQEARGPPPLDPDQYFGTYWNEQTDCISLANPYSRNSALSESQQEPPIYPSTSTVSNIDLEKQPVPDDSDTWKPGRSEWLVMITMAVSCLTVALDSTILVPVLPSLALDLNGTATQAFWAGTSYLLASAVIQPFIAALSDIFGRREATLVSLTLFAIASIICAVAHNFTTLLAGRVLQGIGGGGIISQSQIVYADIVPLRQRPRYFALVLAAWAVGTMLGPLIGGLFAQTAHNWRWCFYLNLPICGIAIGMCFFFLKLSSKHRTLTDKLKLVDWTGGFLFISSLTSFLIAISWGGITYAWTSWRTLVPLILGAAGVLITIIYESRFATNPFLNKTLFQNLSSILTYLSALFQGLVLLMALYYVSFYFAAAKLADPVHVGINLFPATFLLLPGSIICSQLITRLGIYRPFIWAGWAISTLGCGMMIHWTATTSTAYWASTLCITGIGLGVTLSCINFAVQASTTSSNSGAAAAMYAFMRSLGMSLGVAIGGTIFQNLMKQSLRSSGLDESIATNAEAWVETTLRNLPAADAPDNYLGKHALDAYIYGFRGVWIAMTALSVFALLLSLGVRHYSLDRILESKFVVKKEKGKGKGKKESEGAA